METVRRIIELWNCLEEYGINKVSRISNNSKRYKNLISRLNEYGESEIFHAIEQIKDSDFLKGKNEMGWTITFDWFVLQNNFQKVFEGNYSNRNPQRRIYAKDLNNFERRHYDMDKLEIQLMEGQIDEQI